jgi:putative hemolysin
MWGIELVVMAAMIAVNGVLAAYEIALASVSLTRLEVLAGGARKGAAAAAYMKRNVESSLAGIQLGITLVGATAAATGGAGAEEQLAPAFGRWLGVSPGLAEFLAIAAVVVPLTIVTIVFGELIPKVFALRNREWVCLTLSPPMMWFVTAVRPVIWLIESIVNGLTSWGEKRLRGRIEGLGTAEGTELQELRASAARARTSRLIGPQEEKIILAAAALTSRPVREIMLLADAISMLDVDGPPADALVAAHLDMHTRFPLTERPGDPQAVVGYVNFKDIVAHLRLVPHESSLRKIMRAIPSFPDATPVSACLERLIRDRVHIALVRDGRGRVVGLVTLEDMLEELVGEIEDEFDHLPMHVAVSGRGWVVGGGIGPDKLRGATGIELPVNSGDEPPRHLSDWVSQRQTEPLRGGEVVQDGPLRVVVRKVRRHKVLEAQIEKATGQTL